MKPWVDYEPDDLYRHLQANVFAACLLMPKQPTLDAWEEYHSIEVLAEIFDVPLDCVFFRLNLLGISL